MPELPDITVYLEALRARLIGMRLESAAILNPFLLRTADPSVEHAIGARAHEMRRIGKRIAIGFDNSDWWVLHLMIAGRLHWLPAAPKKPSRNLLAIFRFESGVLTLTEAGTKRRASLHVVAGAEGLAELNPGGLEIAGASAAAFARALTARRHTLKRALTDPRIVSGIGNAYSDEILHRAKLSPVRLTPSLTQAELECLYESAIAVIEEWTARLRQGVGDGFPEKVTAFRPEMAVHGRYGLPCPRCGTAVQRIRYASNETNYCPRCQTGGKLLADRALSRLLKKDWPRSIEELERRGQPGRMDGRDELP